MAFTEHYVSVTGAGAHDGTVGDDWTLAEFITASSGLGAGDSVNVISGSYSSGAATMAASGDVSQLFRIRGYASSIGDLEAPGWNADGTLNVTGFPVITLTALFAVDGVFVILQNLSFTASACSAVMVGGTSGDQITLLECKVINSTNNSSAGAVRLDNNCKVLNCDLECSGAAHVLVLDIDSSAIIAGNRIKGVEANQIFCQSGQGGTVVGNLFQGASGAGIGYNCEDSSNYALINNTFYDLGRAISLPNAAATTVVLVSMNNHITDCVEHINNLYSGTATKAIIEVNNRVRDNTTERIGIGDGALVGEVTTDTGGASTDYTDAGSNDFTLISAAPGKATGMRQYTDIGAYQRQEAGGGGGGGGKQAGSGGGQVG